MRGLQHGASPAVVKITVRYPDWITCRNWVNNKRCGAINVFNEIYPVRCVRCHRGM